MGLCLYIYIGWSYNTFNGILNAHHQHGSCRKTQTIFFPQNELSFFFVVCWTFSVDCSNDCSDKFRPSLCFVIDGGFDSASCSVSIRRIRSKVCQFHLYSGDPNTVWIQISVTQITELFKLWTSSSRMIFGS